MNSKRNLKASGNFKSPSAGSGKKEALDLKELEDVLGHFTNPV